MANYPRKTQKVFGGSLVASGNVAQMGSTITGTPVYSTDLDVIQGLPAYGTGFQSQVMNGTASPVMQEVNAFFLMATQQLAYLFQRGTPEYDAATEYGQFCLCASSTGQLYQSKLNANIGNALTNTTWWKPFDPTPTGTIVMKGFTTTPDDYLPCDGSAVSRATYAALFARIGTVWGVGDGSSTFNLPDLRGRVPVGLGTGDAGGATAWTAARKAGQETVTLSSTQIPSHTHTTPSQTVTTSTAPNHTHTTPSQTITTSAAGAHHHNYSSPPTTSAITGPGPSGGDRQAPATLGGPPPWFLANTSDIADHTHQVIVAASNTGAAGTHSHSVTVDASNTGAAGGGQAHTNLTPSLGVPFFIRI